MKSLHASGEWNRPDGTVTAATTPWGAQGADFISHTEVRLHLDALKGITSMRLCRGSGDDGQLECALQVRNDRWRVIETKTVRLSNLVIPRRKSRCYALHVIVEDRATGVRHHRIVIHLPSGVDGIRGIKNNAQGRVYKAAIANLAEYAAALDGPVIVTGDWNLHLRKKWVQELLEDLFPDFEHTPLSVAGGTHGKRLIDFSLARGMRLDQPHIVANPASDHRALAEHQEITVAYRPPVRPFIKARYSGGAQKPKAIVLHGTVSHDDRGTARNIAEWWAGPTSPKTSAHYIVDPAEDIQCVGDHTIAFHCGYNTGSVAVELCDEQVGPAARWDDADSVAILKRAATLVAELCLAYDIDPFRPTVAQLKAKGPHGIYGHNDSRLAFGNTSHTDPRDFDWPEFLAMVRAEVARLRKDPTPPTPPTPKPPTPKPPVKKSRVQQARDLITEASALLMAAAKSSRPGRASALKTEVAKIRAARNRLPKK